MPSYNLDAGSGTQGAQTPKILTSVENIFLRQQPGIVLVQGDTNTVITGALAASKLHIPVGHVEAGLRSFDHTMPEEITSIIEEHIADRCMHQQQSRTRTFCVKESLKKGSLRPEIQS